ncbi:MAG TPA: hypothetical protein VI279_06250 [Rhodocyclaceae bacterium]
MQTHDSGFDPGTKGTAPANTILVHSVWIVFAAVALNAIYFTLRFEFGYGVGTFLSGPSDRFADLIKVALSFKTITQHLADSDSFQNWPTLYQGYLLHNPHGGLENLAVGGLTHFQYPPLSELIFTLCALLISATKSPSAVLWVWFFIYLCGVYCLGKLAQPASQLSTERWLFISFLCLASYPALFMLSRGNYHAGFTSILISIFMVSLFGRHQFSITTMVALALAINIRPTAALFLISLPLTLGLRPSIKPMFRTLILTGALFVATLLIEQSIYPDYTIGNFLRGLEIYRSLYIDGRAGDGGNSSLWAMIRNGAGMTGIFIYQEELWRIFLAGSVFVSALSMRELLAGNAAIAAGPFALVSCYVLLQPVCADYHLLVFIAPLLLIAMNGKGMHLHPNDRIAVIASTILLCPKNYIFVNGISLQTLLNPLVLMCALILMNAGRARDMVLLSTSPQPTGLGETLLK